MSWHRNLTNDINTIEKLLKPVINQQELVVYDSPEYFKNKIQIKLLYNNFNKLVSEIEKEEILCRRYNKRTAKYEKLLDEFDQAVETIEQIIVMFKLMN